MAGILVPKPGSAYLCLGRCHHRDCRQHRNDAAAICRLCDKRIGYGRAWVTLPDGQAAHFDCAEKAARGPDS